MRNYYSGGRANLLRRRNNMQNVLSTLRYYKTGLIFRNDASISENDRRKQNLPINKKYD